MLRLNSLREKLFWTIDGILGGQINKHYRELKLYSTSITEPDFGTKYHRSRLQSLLHHAARTTDFYKEYSSADIDLFPVITKQVIRENFKKFISKKYKKGSLREYITSGSTGYPFSVLKDKNKISRNTADAIYFAELANFCIGKPLIYLKVWNDFNRKHRLVHTLQNTVPIDVKNLSDKSILETLKMINRSYKSVSFLGYVSAIEEFASNIKNNPNIIKNKVESIITMSETLTHNSRKSMQSIFECQNVYARYSNVENGIIAQQFDFNRNEYLINTASYLVEILDMDMDIPIPDGNVGRIVVTDLYNYGMPLIRYDTGDIGSKRKEKIKGRYYEIFLSIDGRKMDCIYNTTGELVSSFTITNGMWNYPELKQYQFVQYDTKKYKFRLNVYNNFDREMELVSEFKSYLGDDAIIQIEYVSEIPLLASGKRKKVVNIMD